MLKRSCSDNTELILNSFLLQILCLWVRFYFSQFCLLFFHKSHILFTFMPQVISLGDVIKFSLSPSKTKDRLSANVSGVPLDDKNLVGHKLTVFLFIFSSSRSCECWKPSFGRLLRPLTFTGRRLGVKTSFG
jgi:hypothetical protein